MSGRIPQLLVSVRDGDEALAALRGGADIIDVKEPSNGSLGRASIEVISVIANVVRSRSVEQKSAVPVSLALGEVNEWLDASDAVQVSDVPSVIRRTQPQFLKLGLSKLRGVFPAKADWYESWMQIRSRIPGEHSWVAVAYADATRARSPSVADVCDAAAKSRCRVLLIDTFEKDESTLLDWLSLEELRRLRTATTDHGQLLALAGRISISQLSRLAEFEPDIIAVRGAVCDHGVRTSAISEERVSEFRAAIRSSQRL